MIPDQETTHHHRAAAISRWTPRRRVHLRRRKLPTVRLGGGARPRRGVLILTSIWRRMRLRWLKLQYRCLLKKLQAYYRKMIEEIAEASASMEMFQQRLLLEAGCAVPVMGANFNTFSSVARRGAVIM